MALCGGFTMGLIGVTHRHHRSDREGYHLPGRLDRVCFPLPCENIADRSFDFGKAHFFDVAKNWKDQSLAAADRDTDIAVWAIHDVLLPRISAFNDG